MIHYESCKIWRLFRYREYQIELVYAPAGYSIKPHTHGNQNIKLMLLFGNNIRFFRQRTGEKLLCFQARFKHIFKIFTINAGDMHYFTVSTCPLVFLNFERWLVKPTSAAIDLQLNKEIKEYAK